MNLDDLECSHARLDRTDLDAIRWLALVKCFLLRSVSCTMREFQQFRYKLRKDESCRPEALPHLVLGARQIRESAA